MDFEWRAVVTEATCFGQKTKLGETQALSPLPPQQHIEGKRCEGAAPLIKLAHRQLTGPSAEAMTVYLRMQC